MNLKAFSDEQLMVSIKKVRTIECKALTNMLHHLREVNSRRLFSAMGYKSLLDFAVKHLGYAEDQAYRRINAMKLLKELPEIEDKITQGGISISHLGIAMRFFNQEKKADKGLAREEKLSVLEKIANQPVREAQRFTLALSSTPHATKPDRISVVSASHIEMKFTANKEVEDKVTRLKGWLAHTHPSISLGDLFEKLCDLALEQWNPSAAFRKRRVRISKAQVRRDVFAKAGACCENCGSHFALQIDHVIPKAKGGADKPENFRVLCRSCNQRAAIREFGLNKMGSFLN